MIVEAVTAAANGVGSMLLAVVVLGVPMLGGAWLMTRNAPCNPYGYDACACGCGTNCEELPGG